MPKFKTLRQAAVDVLHDHGPLHYRNIAKNILASMDTPSPWKAPAESLNTIISIEIKRNGMKSQFIRIRPGVFGLRTLHAPQTEQTSLRKPDSEHSDDVQTDGEDNDGHRVRTPWFPKYSEVGHLLKVWLGRPKRQITKLHTTLNDLSGTPQNPVTWTDPDTWIPERLSGDDRDLANSIWNESSKTVNPRYVKGHWLLSQNHALIEEDADGVMVLTEHGRDFLDLKDGETVALLDEQEGVIKLLALVADNGPTRLGGLTKEWTEYLNRYSAFGKPSTVHDTLRRRLSNLLDRDLINRKGTMYSITETGLAYLQRIDTEEVLGGDEQQEIWNLAAKQEAAVRESLRELLLDMDAYVFEHLIKRLLEEMNYQNVEVTTQSGDGGVDVIADIELGITSVREVVQAKRHRRTIQRKDLDALRGSLYRFNAVRGTIITTSDFSSGTKKEAFAGGAAPITLIDGEKLIDLLIDHGIGVHKRNLDVLAIDPDAFSDLGEDTE